MSDLTFTVRGTGRPVLLLHGGAGSQSVSVLAERLASVASVRVVTPVHDGFEAMSVPPDLVSITTLAARYAQLLDERELYDVAVIGHSTGSWIATEIARLGSPCVARLIVVDAVGFKVANHSSLPDPSLLGQLGGVTVPTLVICSDADGIADPDYSRALAAAIPGARFKLFATTGHLLQIETLERFARAITDFLIMPAVRARVVEASREHGFGKVTLPTGETLRFDVEVCVRGFPDVGVDAAVLVGPTRTSALAILQLAIIATWPATTLPFVCLQVTYDAVELLYIDGGTTVRTEQPRSGTPISAGMTGHLVLEHKQGSSTYLETRIPCWSVDEVEAGVRAQLLAAYRAELVASWTDWQSVDRAHCPSMRHRLLADVRRGLSLGLDVERLLEITDFPVIGEEPGPGF